MSKPTQDTIADRISRTLAERIIRGALETISFEAATHLGRAASSTIINQSNERNASVIDAHGRLAAGQLARVFLREGAGGASLIVPSDAVIGSGERARVIVRHGDAHFAPVAVRTGRSRGGRTEILAGLEGGEQVVVSGQFLLDSEASLAGGLERLGGHGAHP